MQIVINAAGLFWPGVPAETRRYFTHCLESLVRDKPQVDFCFLADREMAGQWKPAEAAEVILINRLLPGRLGRADWQNRLVPATLATMNPDLLLTVGGAGVKKWKGKQTLWTAASGKLKKPAGAARLVTAFDETGLKWKENQSAADSTAVFVPPVGDDAFEPQGWTDKENTKVRFSGGREYFVTRSHYKEADLLMVLKAFSLFKKRQQSNLQLLITGMPGEAEQVPFDKLENYKYRQDVHVNPRMSRQHFIDTTAAAYGLVQTGSSVDALAVLNAFQAQVPVISAAKRDTEEGIGGLLWAENNHESLAEKMMILYKDEVVRNEMIGKGKLLARQLSLQQASKTIWKGLMRAADIAGKD